MASQSGGSLLPTNNERAREKKESHASGPSTTFFSTLFIFHHRGREKKLPRHWRCDVSGLHLAKLHPQKPSPCRLSLNRQSQKRESRATRCIHSAALWQRGTRNKARAMEGILETRQNVWKPASARFMVIAFICGCFFLLYWGRHNVQSHGHYHLRDNLPRRPLLPNEKFCNWGPKTKNRKFCDIHLFCLCPIIMQHPDFPISATSGFWNLQVSADKGTTGIRSRIGRPQVAHNTTPWYVLNMDIYFVFSRNVRI